MDPSPDGAPPDTGLCVLFTTAPDRAWAEQLAQTLVRDRLAACVSILAPATSVYRWQGAVESAQEWPLMIKAATARVPALRQALKQIHPYAVPELIVLPVIGGLPEYIRWALEASESDAAPQIAN